MGLRRTPIKIKWDLSKLKNKIEALVDYRKNSKSWDISDWVANCVDPDQTAPQGAV